MNVNLTEKVSKTTPKHTETDKFHKIVNKDLSVTGFILFDLSDLLTKF